MFPKPFPGMAPKPSPGCPQTLPGMFPIPPRDVPHPCPPTWVNDLLHPGMGFQEFGHSQGVLEVQLHPDVQSLQPTVTHVTVKGGGNSSQGCGNRIPQKFPQISTESHSSVGVLHSAKPNTSPSPASLRSEQVGRHPRQSLLLISHTGEPINEAN